MSIYDKSTRELLIQFASEQLQPGQVFTSAEVFGWFKGGWPKISAGTIRATLTALTTNHTSRVHHPIKPGPTHDLFYRIARSQYRLWNRSSDPTPIYPQTTASGQTQVMQFSGAVKEVTEPLPATTFEEVTAKHIWEAVQALRAGNVEHPFIQPTGYDVLVDDDARLSPNAVFGVAATTALGYQILPHHFSSDLTTICFQKIEEAGYEIVPKDQQSLAEIAPPSDEAWTEGGKKLIAHLRSERSRGLSAAKKADFISQHGALFCEWCECDPVTEYGEHGEACIEVHHMVQISEMEPGHQTKLSDVICLCANCHRIMHRELRQKTQAQNNLAARND